jgi:hypothetical protein
MLSAEASEAAGFYIKEVDWKAKKGMSALKKSIQSFDSSASMNKSELNSAMFSSASLNSSLGANGFYSMLCFIQIIF